MDRRQLLQLAGSVVEFTQGQLTSTLRAVVDVVLPNSGIRTLAQFTVLQGRPVLEQS